MNPPLEPAGATPYPDPPPPVPGAAAVALRIGVFDSGVGGLSVLRSLQALLPTAALTYVADSHHAPYGEREDAFVIERSERIASWLIANAKAQLLVVACNTATAAAVHRLRELWPAMPIVGVEPGLKPAMAASRRRHVGVLATVSTLLSGKFQRLLDQHGIDANVYLQQCPGLAAHIEAGWLDDPLLIAMVDAFCAPMKRADVDVVVLGCTHYAFVQHHIARAMGPGVTIIDTADAVARHAASLASKLQPVDDDRVVLQAPRNGAALAPRVRLYTTGDAERLTRVAKSWLSFDAGSAETIDPRDI